MNEAMKINEEEIKLLRKSIPMTIAQELCSVQPIELTKEQTKQIFVDGVIEDFFTGVNRS